MLTKVEAHTPSGAVLSLPLGDVSGGYTVKDIDGINPVKATIVSSKFAQLPGSQYQSSRRENRNIVITLGIEQNNSSMSVADRRAILYGFFMPTAEVFLKFFVDDVYFAYASGRVESFETSIFSKEPEVVISILSFDPDLIAPSSVVVNGSSVSTTTEQSVTYNGTTVAGFLFKLMVDRAITEMTIYNNTPSGESLSYLFVGSLIAGDVLAINTVAGNKYATVTRSGTPSSVLYAISPASSWFGLYPGVNNLRVFIAGAAVPFTLEYTARYGGL